MRLEGDKGSLTGVLPPARRGGRARPDLGVDRALPGAAYEFDTGKMVGRATITVQIKVFVFSGSVQISAETEVRRARTAIRRSCR